MAVKKKTRHSVRNALGRWAAKPTAHDTEQAQAQQGNTKDTKKSRWAAAKARRAQLLAQAVKDRKEAQAKLNKRVGTRPNTRKAKQALASKQRALARKRIPRADLQTTSKKAVRGKKLQTKTFRFEGADGWEAMNELLSLYRKKSGVSTRIVAGTDFGRDSDWVGTTWNHPALTYYDIERLKERYKFMVKLQDEEDERDGERADAEAEGLEAFHWYELTVRSLVNARKASHKRTTPVRGVQGGRDAKVSGQTLRKRKRKPSSPVSGVPRNRKGKK